MSDFDRTFEEAVALHRTGQWDAALALYGACLAERPAHFRSHWNRAIALDQAASWNLSLPAWQRVVALSPNNTEAMLRLGRGFLRNDNSAAAIAMLLRVLDIPDLTPDREHTARGLLLEAFRQTHDWESVANTASTVLTARPDDSVMLYHLGLARHHQHRWHEARTAYEKVLAAAPHAPTAHHHVKARENLARAEQERQPQDALRYTLSEIVAEADRQMMAGRLSDAERFYRVALQQAPNNSPTLARLARLSRLTGSGDGVALMEEALATAQTPENRQLHAWLLQGAGRLKEAIQTLEASFPRIDQAPPLRVVWRSDPERLWESSWLRHLLGGLPCDHSMTMPTTVTDQPILIISGLPSRQEEAEHAALAAAGARLGLVLLSDEYYTTPASALAPFRLILRNYWSERLAADPRVTIFPLGYKDGIANAQPTPDARQRAYSWCFMGNASPLARRDMLRQLERVPGGFIHRTDSFHDQKALPVDAYAAKLRESVFVPCPAGNNLETFRVYEALECGAIPIVEEWFADPYYTRLLGPCPFLTIRRWSEAPHLIQALLAAPDQLMEHQKTCQDWWADTKDYFQKTLALQVINHTFVS